MKKCLAGLVVGVIVGIVLGGVGTIRWLLAKAHRLDRDRKPPVELTLPENPVETTAELTKYLDGLPYEIGFFAKNLTTGITTERFADRSVCLASIVKIFCLTELYRQKEEHELDLNQEIEVAGHGAISLAEAADLMIGRSDNEATQAFTEFLGRERVNRIPSLLGIESMSADILPENGTFRQTLDKRIFGDRIAAARLPQHGTARGMAHYFELLLDGQVISERTSADLIKFFTNHPKPFSSHYAGEYEFAGKGGNLLWTRPPKHYSMMGWSLYVTKPSGDYIVLCVWGEWFPENMPPDLQSEFLKYVTDCVLSILES